MSGMTYDSDGSSTFTGIPLLTTSPTAFNDGAGTTGTFTYLKQSATTGRLTYTANYSEPGFTYRESATINLTFWSASQGSYTASSGTYSGSFEGDAFSGSFTGDGQFVFDSPPVISNVPNFSTAEDTPATLPFTISDPGISAESLAVTASSSNHALVPSANISLGGSGSNRTVTLAPAVNQTGTSTITLTVSDGTDTTADTFVLTVTAVNDTPAISDVADQETLEDTPTALIPFTVFDAETASPTVTCTASSNTALVPVAAVTLAGSGTNRTVKVTPTANNSGTSLITLRVSDGTNSSTDTFLITVAAVNDPPTISNVANRSVVEDNFTTTSCTVSDIDTQVEALTISAGSSNPFLVPVESIAISGTGATRTVVITPAANQTGTSTISLIVSDGALSATDTFVLTVTSVNDAPAISAAIPDLVITNGSSTGPLPFTIFDAETAATALTVTRASSSTAVIPVSNVVLGGAGTDRTVTITAASGQIGSSTITLNVSDGSLAASYSFAINVINAQTLSGWRQLHFSNTANTGDGADLNDFDGDGIVNLMEFALGSLPKDHSSAARPVITTETVADIPYLTLTLTKPANIMGINYAVQVSGNLTDWGGGSPHTTVITDSSTTLKVRDNTPATPGTRFIRLAVTSP